MAAPYSGQRGRSETTGARSSLVSVCTAHWPCHSFLLLIQGLESERFKSSCRDYGNLLRSQLIEPAGAAQKLRSGDPPACIPEFIPL
jgi:hypothetical protein